TKYSGIPLALPLAAVALLLAVRSRRVLSLLAGTAAALAIAAPWYVANWIRFRNPLYPLLASVFGGQAESGERLLHWHGSASDWLTYIVRPETLDSDLGGIGLALAVAAAAGYAIARRRHLEVVGIVAAGFLALAAFGPAARILLPAVAGGCLVAALAYEDYAAATGKRWPI